MSNCEYRTGRLGVGGSNPLAPTTKALQLQGFLLFRLSVRRCKMAQIGALNSESPRKVPAMTGKVSRRFLWTWNLVLGSKDGSKRSNPDPLTSPGN
jgi:hypothetical protein